MPYNTAIKLTGIFLIISGWIIMLSSIALLGGGARTEFAAAGGAVEAGGLALLCRAHAMDARNSG